MHLFNKIKLITGLHLSRFFKINSLFYFCFIFVFLVTCKLYNAVNILTKNNKSIYSDISYVLTPVHKKYPDIKNLRKNIYQEPCKRVETEVFISLEESNNINELGSAVYNICNNCRPDKNIEEILNCDLCFKTNFFRTKISKKYYFRSGINNKILKTLNLQTKASDFTDIIGLLALHSFFLYALIQLLKKEKYRYILIHIDTRSLILSEIMINALIITVIYAISLYFGLFVYTQNETNILKINKQISKLLFEKMLFFKTNKLFCLYCFNFTLYSLIILYYIRFAFSKNIDYLTMFVSIFVFKTVIDYLILDSNPWYFAIYDKNVSFEIEKTKNEPTFKVFENQIFKIEDILSNQKTTLYYKNIHINSDFLIIFMFILNFLLFPLFNFKIQDRLNEI